MSSDRFDFSPSDETIVAPNGGLTDSVLLVTEEQNLRAESVDSFRVWFVNNDAYTVQETAEEESDTQMEIDVAMEIPRGVGNVSYRQRLSAVGGIDANPF